MTRNVAFLFSLFVGTATVAPQVPPQFRSGVDLVRVPATVWDNDHRAVTGLPASAFTVLEDGRPRPIEVFSDAWVPMSIVIALDASGSMSGPRFARAAAAVLMLMDRLGPLDEVYIYGFNDAVFRVSDWTRDRRLVEIALSGVQPKGLTALYDSVGASIEQLRRRAHRPRQAVVLISDGNDRRDIDFSRPAHIDYRLLVRARPAIIAIKRSEAVVYAVGIDGPSPRAEQDLDVNALRRLTDPSGGTTEVVRSDDVVPAAVSRIADDLSHQYLIGFRPSRGWDGRTHRLEIQVSACPCQVRARGVYVAFK